jgi:DNA polymerase-4
VAKRFGVKTGEPLHSARAKCPHIVFLPAHYGLYAEYSEQMRSIYRRFTDRIESFGIDECWLDVTASQGLFGDGKTIANEIRALSKKELGLTISAGVSFNKIFAKMGSDYKKPDATTLITRDNYKELLWPLPVEDLLFVGKATAERLHLFGMHKIGDIALYDPKILEKYFGKNGVTLYNMANGNDHLPVCHDSYRRPPESVGNSVTLPRDILKDEEAAPVLYMLCDSVASRLRAHGLYAAGLAVTVKNSRLESRSKHLTLKEATHLTSALYPKALSVFRMMKKEGEQYRSLGVCAEHLTPAASFQISLFDDSFKRAKKEQLEETVDALRQKFGREIIGGALYLTHQDLTTDHPLGRKVSPFGK